MRKGARMTPEHRTKWAAAMAAYNADPEYLARLSEGRRLAWAKKTPEERAAFAAKISAAKKGKGNGLNGRKKSPEHRLKMSEAAKRRGPNNPFYKDGRGHERDTVRRWAMKGVKYRLWREAVFERDDYTCQACNVRGRQLHADHIIRWKDNEMLRFDVSNGRTLCEPCHRASPTWGNR